MSIVTNNKDGSSANIICSQNNVIFIDNKIGGSTSYTVDKDIITRYGVPKEYMWTRIYYVFSHQWYTITENNYSIYDIIW